MIINSMEKAVDLRLKEMIKQTDNVCRCEICLEDMMCIALNRLPAKYVSSPKGEIFTKIDQQMNSQNKTDIDIAVSFAISFVKDHRRH